MAQVFPLVAALLLSAVPGRAADPAPIQSPADKAHPEFLRLEQDLADKLAERKAGQLPPEQYLEWERAFRASLDELSARVPTSPDNTAAHARIIAQLGERKQAGKTLDQALETDPDSPVLLRTKGRLLYEQKDYPAAAQYGLEAWEKSGRTDQSALALYHQSKGRGAPSGTTASVPQTPGPASAALSAPTVAPQPARNMPVARTPSIVPLPSQVPFAPPQDKKKLPRWPLTLPFAGGLIAYGFYRAKQDGAASDSPADEPVQAFMTPEVAAVAAAPAAEAAKKVIGAALKKGAQAAAVSATATAVITAATFGVIVGAGVATIYGLDQMIEAQDKYNESIDTRRDLQPAPSGRSKNKPRTSVPTDPERVWVVRAGIATPEQLKNGVDEHPRVRGLTGFSVQSQAGKTIEELAAAGKFRNGQISVTTSAELLAVGVPIVKSPGNGYHNTAKTEKPLTDSHALAISSVFKSRPNPAQVK